MHLLGDTYTTQQKTCFQAIVIAAIVIHDGRIESVLLLKAKIKVLCRILVYHFVHFELALTHLSNKWNANLNCNTV